MEALDAVRAGGDEFVVLCEAVADEADAGMYAVEQRGGGAILVLRGSS